MSSSFPDKILFFDGVCAMCNGLVLFVLKHDKKQNFSFAPLQGKTAQVLIPDLIDWQLKTVILKDQEKIYTESDAIIRLSMGIGGIFYLAAVLKIIPKFIRDGVYRLIAKNRYRWFGKLNSCALVNESNRRKILD